MTFSAVHRPAAIPTGRGDRGQLWVKDGKTRYEHMFSGMAQIADIGQPACAIGEALDAWQSDLTGSCRVNKERGAISRRDTRRSAVDVGTFKFEMGWST